MSKPAPVHGLVYDPEKPRFDRVAQSQVVFDAFNFQSDQLDTVILLLQSPEDAIVVRALQHLDTFTTQYVGNYAELFNRRILEFIFPLANHQLLSVRRFVLKLISQLFIVPEATEQLRNSDECFSLAVDTFIASDDSFLVEYAAIVCNQLALLNADYLEKMRKSAKLISAIVAQIAHTSDPDIMLQSLKLLDIISDDPLGLERLCGRNDFPFETVVAEMQSQYLQIQTAALAVLSTATKCTNSAFARNFEDPSFVERIFEILENPNWQHIHLATIALLSRVLRRKATAELFYKDGSLERFFAYIQHVSDDQHRLAAMEVPSELAQYPEARLPLHESGFPGMLIRYLQEPKVQHIATGIARMANHKLALEEFLNNSVVSMLLGVLGSANVAVNDPAKSIKKPPKKGDKPAVAPIDPAQQIADKLEAAQCLAELFRLSDSACLDAMNAGAVEIIANMLQQDLEEVAIELKWPLIAMLNWLSRIPSLRPKVMTYAMAGGVHKTLREAAGCTMFVVEVLRCLCNYIELETVMDQLMQTSDTALMLIDNLCAYDEPMMLRQATVDLIVASRKHPELTDMYIDQNVLDCLLRDADSLANCPNWSTAIEAIVANNLPVKFALRGHLEPTDCTQNGFYATNKIWTHYRRLRQIFCSQCSPRRTILFVNFQIPRSVSNISVTSAKTTQTIWSMRESQQFNRRPNDPRLPEYIRLLLEALEIEHLRQRMPPKSLADIRRCCELIADLVTTKICSRPFEPLENEFNVQPVQSFASLTSASSCSCQADLDAAIAAHLEELRREEYNCNIIPLGAIRVGGYFEKSMLFKVLADRVGLASGWRMLAHDQRIVCNEVRLPEEEEEEVESGPAAECSASLLDVRDEAAQTTHIVDLMDQPGNLYAIGSQRALQYQLQVSTQ